MGKKWSIFVGREEPSHARNIKGVPRLRRSRPAAVAVPGDGVQNEMVESSLSVSSYT